MYKTLANLDFLRPAGARSRVTVWLLFAGIALVFGGLTRSAAEENAEPGTKAEKNAQASPNAEEAIAKRTELARELRDVTRQIAEVRRSAPEQDRELGRLSRELRQKEREVRTLRAAYEKRLSEFPPLARLLEKQTRASVQLNDLDATLRIEKLDAPPDRQRKLPPQDDTGAGHGVRSKRRLPYPAADGGNRGDRPNER